MKKKRNRVDGDINNKDSSGKDKSKENQDLIAFASYIFNQVKMQQETRDKWMEFYFAIFAGVATFATFALSFFDDKLKMEQLECIIGIVFILTGVIGVIFYLLFLCQRLNYKLHYKVLGEIQRKIVGQYLSKPYETYYQENRSPFKKFKKGADFYASFIQNVIIVACFVIGIIFIMLGLQVEKIVIMCCCLVIALVIESILRVLYNSFEKII